ncbi:hypothetical protein FIBSPDRAFT_900108 [Athelia psychrophila]|uniref:Uncharacterized protein n=1 Tax=Athelia psychrophila TaxID=1759441 RepID=A0A165YVU0_9AGAM|nr:hypothetical protein FIBSPDRAFT_900108 [Fibularhizoctonia sp. CBS 109695]
MTTRRVPNLNGKIRKRNSPLALNMPSRVDLSLNTYGGFGDVLIDEKDVGRTTRTAALKVLHPRPQSKVKCFGLIIKQFFLTICAAQRNGLAYLPSSKIIHGDFTPTTDNRPHSDRQIQ